MLVSYARCCHHNILSSFVSVSSILYAIVHIQRTKSSEFDSLIHSHIIICIDGAHCLYILFLIRCLCVLLPRVYDFILINFFVDHFILFYPDSYALPLYAIQLNLRA